MARLRLTTRPAKTVAVAALVAGLLPLAPGHVAYAAPFCQPGESPEFRSGFASLKEQLGPLMGDPSECEHLDAATGDTLQNTTTGLAYYRKATNTPTLTDGQRHWALTADGLIAWEGGGPDPPGVSEASPASSTPVSRAPVVAAAPAVGQALLEDPLTAPGAAVAYRCPTGRNAGEFVGEGLLLKVTGKCRDQDTSAFAPTPLIGITLPDGEIRVEVRAVSGHERATFLIDFRIQSDPVRGYVVYFLPARGVAHRRRPGDTTSREDRPGGAAGARRLEQLGRARQRARPLGPRERPTGPVGQRPEVRHRGHGPGRVQTGRRKRRRRDRYDRTQSAGLGPRRRKSGSSTTQRPAGHS